MVAIGRGERYGLEILKAGGSTRGGVYNQLNRLMDKGLVQFAGIRPSHRGFDRNYYRLSPRGLLLLQVLEYEQRDADQPLPST